MRVSGKSKKDSFIQYIFVKPLLCAGHDIGH